MRVMLIWDGVKTEVGNLIAELTNNNHQLVYWLGTESEKQRKQPTTVFHDCLKALYNLPAPGFSVEQFPAPSKELIEQLHHLESIFLTMMCSKFSGLKLEERRHFYYNCLQYWHGVLNQLKPEVIIFVTVPHATFDYLIYELARLLRVKTLVIEGTWISDRAYLYSDFRLPIPALAKQQQLHAGKNFTPGDLAPDLKNYYLKQTDPAKDSTPLYMPIQFKQYLGKGLLKRRLKHLKNMLKDGTVAKDVFGWLKKKIGPNLKKDYQALQVEPDLAKPYIYAALHLQPEMTTSPQGDIYVDQILMLETLAWALPPRWVIYVKEHPIQWLFRGLSYFDLRYRGYYQKIAALKNVFLVPVNFSSFKLIEQSRAVATVTGTVAWEGVLRQKPGLVFGYPWYRACPGIFTINSCEQCRDILKQINNGSFKVRAQDTLNFLHYFDKATIHGYINMDIEKNTTLTPGQSAANIRSALLKELNKLQYES